MGIDPGCRYVGTAVIEGKELVHHQVFDVKGASTRQVLANTRRAVTRLIEAYEPDQLVVEKTFFSKGRRAPLLRRVSDEILAVAKRYKVPVELIAPVTLKKRITGNGHASKDEVARVVSQRYQVLKPFVGMHREWHARFHSNMFDAVALALDRASANHKCSRVSRRIPELRRQARSGPS